MLDDQDNAYLPYIPHVHIPSKDLLDIQVGKYKQDVPHVTYHNQAHNGRFAHKD